MMPKLVHEVKIKKEIYGTFRHDSYKIIIPYRISQDMNLQDSVMLHSTASKKTRTIRLHRKPVANSVPIKIRHRYTKTYKNMRYYSTQITIPIQFIRELDLSENNSFDVYCTKNTISIKAKRA